MSSDAFPGRRKMAVFQRQPSGEETWNVMFFIARANRTSTAGHRTELGLSFYLQVMWTSVPPREPVLGPGSTLLSHPFYKHET